MLSRIKLGIVNVWSVGLNCDEFSESFFDSVIDRSLIIALSSWSIDGFFGSEKVKSANWIANFPQSVVTTGSGGEVLEGLESRSSMTGEWGRTRVHTDGL